MSTGAELQISLHDVTAREDSTPTCDGAAGFAPASSLGEPGKLDLPDCATLEGNFFRLDGSFAPFPDVPQGQYWGLWSDQMSDDEGVFATPPVLRVAFTRNHSSVGLTLRFYRREQDYIRHLRVRWLDGEGNVLSAKDFFPTDATPFLRNKVEGYRGLEITFLKTAKPRRYLKLAGLDYGLEMLLGGGELSRATVLEEVDPTGATVSVNTLDVTVHSPSADFSPLNTGGYFSLFQQNQRLLVTALLGEERKPMGSFYLRSWEADGKNNVQLRGVDAVGVMDSVSWRGGIYQNVPAGTLLGELFAAAKATVEPDSKLANKKLSGYLPAGTARQALGQIALAIGGVVDASRGEVVRIYPLPQRPSALIEPFRKFSGQRIALRPEITDLEVTAHSFTPLEERYTAFDQNLTRGQYVVLFGEPTHNPVATGATIVDTGANHVTLAVAATGKVTVVGGRYLHAKQTLSQALPMQSANVAENRLRVTNATLVHSANAKELLSRLQECCTKGLTAEFSIPLGTERVADMVVVRSSQGESLKGIIESMETDLTGGCITKLRLAAQRAETTSNSYTSELHAGERLGVM